MNTVKFIAVAMLAVTTSATAASTVKMTVADCNRLATQVNRALKANETTPNYDAAQKEKQYGSHFCSVGDFPRGVDRYNQALAILAAHQRIATPSP